MKPIVLTGIKPSGKVHLGNYIGAIKHWVTNQGVKTNFFMIADLHTITVPQDPKILKRRTRELAAWLIAAGIEQTKSTLFIQSQNPDHTSLSWILNCFTSVGELNRMTQYKEKSQKQTDFISAGLYDYPVLMAADILLYNTDEVPVGDDQKQHVELTRNIAQRFNSRYKVQVLKEPEPIIAETGARIKSLQDPRSKMSKSEKDPQGTINMADDPDTIRKKIMRAVTDSGSEIKHSKNKPAISNLLQIYSELSGRGIPELEQTYAGKGYGEFKKDLAEVVVNTLKPIQQKYQDIVKSKKTEQILYSGLQKAISESSKTITIVEKTMGLD